MATIEVGQRRNSSGQFVKRFNDIGYVATAKIQKAANSYTAVAYSELLKMSRAFLDSYNTESKGQSTLPRDKGNLIDSTSIVVSRGLTARTQGSEGHRSIHLDKQAHLEAKWGNWGNVPAGKGYGVNFRMDSIEDTMDMKDSDLAVSLRIGIPYSVPLNDLGAGPLSKHRGFFRWFAADFEHNVVTLSKEVAAALNNASADALIFEGKK